MSSIYVGKKVFDSYMDKFYSAIRTVDRFSNRKNVEASKGNDEGELVTDTG